MPTPPATTNFQTPATDLFAGALVGNVNFMTVIDPTENPPLGEETTLLETGEPFNVKLDWQLTGPLAVATGGLWIVQLFAVAIDGGASPGLLGTSPAIPIVPGAPPLPFSFTFGIAGPVVPTGLYQLTATINHSTNGIPANLTEMMGFAQTF